VGFLAADSVIIRCRVYMVCITPLYHFDSDSSELVLADGIRIVALAEYRGPEFDEEAAKYLQIYEPPYLIFHDPVLSAELFLGEATESPFHVHFEPELDSYLHQNQETGDSAELIKSLLYGTGKLLTLLRLFKPGRLRPGQTFIVSDSVVGEFQVWHTIGSGRASSLVVDYHRLADQTESYALNSADVSSLSIFVRKLTPFMHSLGRFRALETALQIFGAENGPRLGAIEVVTALEALITKKDEVEGLTYRLAMRTANLLGRDAVDRKSIFRQVKQFYGVRSRLVHGAEDDKIVRRLDELEPMRELLRRLLLSVMSLLGSGYQLLDIPDLIDELAFDDKKRREIQELASAFFYM
jgi:hypothetical protein